MLVKKIHSIIDKSIIDVSCLGYVKCILNILQHYKNIPLHAQSNVGKNNKNEICIILIHKDDFNTNIEIVIGSAITFIINGMIENFDDKYRHQNKFNNKLDFFKFYLISILNGKFSKIEFWLLNLFKIGIQMEYDKTLAINNKIFVRHYLIYMIIRYFNLIIIKKRYFYVQFIPEIL